MAKERGKRWAAVVVFLVSFGGFKKKSNVKKKVTICEHTQKTEPADDDDSAIKDFQLLRFMWITFIYENIWQKSRERTASEPLTRQRREREVSLLHGVARA